MVIAKHFLIYLVSIFKQYETRLELFYQEPIFVPP